MMFDEDEVEKQNISLNGETRADTKKSVKIITTYNIQYFIVEKKGAKTVTPTLHS